MISGALFLRTDYDASPERMVKKAVKVLLVMLMWSLLYSFVKADESSVKAIVFATIKGPFHFWFFEYLLGLYLLIPVLKSVTDYNNGTMLRYYLVLFLIFGIGKESINAIPLCHKWIMDVTGKIHVEMMNFVGYFFLGHYLNKTQSSVSVLTLICLFLGVVVMHVLLTTHGTLMHNTDNWWACTFVEAVCIWLWMKKIQVIHRNVTAYLARMTMGVFIVHPLVMLAIPEAWWCPSLYILDVMAILTCSFLLTMVLTKIPGLKELVKI